MASCIKRLTQSIHAQVLQAIIPHSMRHGILTELDGNCPAGHPGPDKMLLKARRYATRPYMSRDVAKFVKNCAVCDQMCDPNPRNLTPRIPLGAKHVWDWVVCD